ncbi:dicarboxylate/amino acid:cation symporter [Silvibacterium dinghuense]|uniref:Cation:dicarboxylase symporter family transporter n=1 Tax=Silvibacterium dinghuense TaxID=1560006 RepID=A0A4Q1SB01_9BACT|nr:cation:dicarboxylase symporter family transporter [Silvibacterium dinghuense]RXS94324.1 cation:dicarboxylase symporter family transporter [Silvibacterium dinghuense]GGH16898.1 transporter dicarboxylate/amino acid:cation Na+/H+ symporter family protein [Silvibacterium dinghuense]
MALFLAGFALTRWPHAAEAIRLVGVGLVLAWALTKRTLTAWIFFSMVAGVELGLDAPQIALSTHVLSDVFLRLIKVIVAPLIFGTLVTGICGHGEIKSVGRLGLKSLVYFELLTTVALVIGLVAIHVSHAGTGLQGSVPPVHAEATATITPANAVPEPPTLSWQHFLLNLFPENIAKAVADNQILQVAVFALLFGLALAHVREEKRAPMLRLTESLTETMFAFTNLVMYAAPLGVGAALAFTIAQSGLGVMVNLGKLLLTLYAALIAFALLGMLPAALIARIPVRRFLRYVAEPATIAFATSTSEAALPRAIEAMEAFGVPRRIVGFVIPTGYSFNLAGSALYLALASIFVAQASNIHLKLSEQLIMLGTLMLTSKGVAGVPRATLVVLLASASIFHLPPGPIFVLLGIDALMDMGRTVVNVVGNCLASAVVARWEGELGSETPSLEAAVAVADAE